MRQLPHSIHAEQQLIATLFRFNEAWPAVCNVVQPDDFHIDMHQVIFEHIGKLLENGEPADLATVDESIERNCHVGADFYRYLHSQFSASPATELSANNALQLAHTVRGKAVLRSLVKTCEEIIESVEHPAKRDVRLILDNAEARIFGVAESASMKPHQSLQNMVDDAMTLVDERSQRGGAGESSGLETGFTELDRCIHGLQRGDLVLLASRPGMGKRAMTLKIVEHICINAAHPVLIFSLERSGVQFCKSLLASRAAINVETLRRGNFAEKDRAALADAAMKLSKAPLIISDGIRTRSIVDLRAQMRRAWRQLGQLDLIVIDSFQALADSMCTDDSKIDRDTLLRTLKALALELSAPILVLAELSNPPEARDDKRPRLMDLRNNGINHQWADRVLSLYQEDLDPPDSGDDPLSTEIHMLKNCDGSAGGMVRLALH